MVTGFLSLECLTVILKLFEHSHCNSSDERRSERLKCKLGYFVRKKEVEEHAATFRGVQLLEPIHYPFSEKGQHINAT